MPVDPTRVDEFDPEAVPDVGRLLKELDEAEMMDVDGEGRDDRNGEYWRFLCKARRLTGCLFCASGRLGEDIIKTLRGYA